MRKTVIQHPDGSVTTVTTKGGCSSGCGFLVTAFLLVLVLAIPAASFGPWAIPAYIALGAIVVLVIVQHLSRRRAVDADKEP